MRRSTAPALAALGALLLTAPAVAQDLPGTDAGNHRTRRTETQPFAPPTFRRDDAEFRVGTLAQAFARVPLERAAQADVFSVPRARLALRATLAGRFGAYVRAELAGQPALLDAEVTARVAPALRLRAGRFKTPFSYEFTEVTSGTDFADRARVVRALVPGRRVGIEALVGGGARPIELLAGVFNARGLDGAGARGRLLGVGRVAVHLPASFVEATGVRGAFGANVAAEDGPLPADTAVVAGRTLAGVDGRVRMGRVVVAAEWLREYARRAPADDRTGYYVTAGYDISLDHRVLARLDRFAGSSDLVLGYNTSLHPAVTALVNVVVPLNDRAGSRRAGLVIGTQVAF